MPSLSLPLRLLFFLFLGQQSRLWVPTALLTPWEGVGTVLGVVAITTGCWVQMPLSPKLEI